MITGLFDWPTQPGFTTGQSGWTTGPGDTTTYSAISGPAINNIVFSANFAGAQTSKLSLYLYAWDESTLKDKALASWSGSAWTFTTLPVPEPTTMIAGALLLPFGASTLRMLRKTRAA